jgi:hypothetical protein
VLSFPAPRKLAYQRIHEPSEIQPIDENIGWREIGQFADDIACDVLCLKSVNVWNSGDYCHAVLGNLSLLDPPKLGRAFPNPLMHRACKFLGKVAANVGHTGRSRKKKLTMVRRALGAYDPA